MATDKEILIIEIRADGARVVKRNLNDIGTTADKVTDVATKLSTVLGGVISARVIKDTVMLADRYANLLNRMRVVTSSNYELNRAMEGVYQITRETRTALEGNVDMYARVALNTRKMGFAMQDVLRFSKQLNHAIILSGVTAREAQWGMVQFSQALAAGALRGDELRAVMEQLPVVTDVIVDHLGVTRGELRKLAFEGRVTSKVIIEAFNAAEKDLAERFGKRVPTLDQGITVLRSSFIRFIGEQDRVWQGTSTLAQVLLWASDNMDTLGRFAQIAGAVIGGILLNNTIKIIAQWKLFSLQVLKTHGWLVLLAAATAAIVVFADKITLAAGETATLADVVRGLGPEFKAAGEGAAIMWNNLADASGLDKLKVSANVTLEGILITIGRVADRFAGIMQGIVATIINGVRVIGDQLMRVLRHLGAFFKAIFMGFKQDLAAMRSSIIATAKAAQAALRGNLEQAKMAGNVAVAALKVGAGTGVIDFYKQQAAEIEANFSSTGKTSGEAFWEAFHGAGTASEDMMKRAIERGRVSAAQRDAGGLGAGKDEGALTPQQSQLLDKVTGNLEKITAGKDDLKVLFDQGWISAQQFNRAMGEFELKGLEASTSVADGFRRGFLEMGLEITNFADMAAKTVTNAFKGMEDALVSFVTTGKVDFKSLVDSMLADLTRLLARQLIVKALGSLGGGGGSALAGLFSTAAPTAARAAGGPVSPGVPYEINEHSGGRAKEVFIAGTQGRVVNNREAQGLGQQGQPPVIKVVNVWSTDDVINTMKSSEGERVIVNYSPGRAQKQ